MFTSVHPYQQAVGRLPCELAIPVTRICHITHEKEAREIRANCMLKGTQKYGKSYDWTGSPLGESFHDCFLSPTSEIVELFPNYQVYKHIDSKTSLLPEGFYSWWSVSTSDWPISEREEELKDYWESSDECPVYLQYPSSSIYGNIEFSGELHKVLSSYQTSMIGPQTSMVEPDVYLLVGGTLRYRHEICCVIIVCTGEDKDSQELRDYKPLQYDCTPESNLDHPLFISNGLTDATGKVTEFSGTSVPTFHPRFLATSMSWASLAFAFYFRRSSGKLWCPGVLQEREIKHDRDNCLKKQPQKKPSRSKKWVCPNELEEPQEHYKLAPKKLSF